MPDHMTEICDEDLEQEVWEERQDQLWRRRRSGTFYDPPGCDYEPPTKKEE